MIVGIQDIYYSVTDSKRAIKFYTEALGMKLIEASEYWIALECHGVKIGLHPVDHPIPHIPRDSHGAHAGATLTLKSTTFLKTEKH
jgi:catechol 2,3-dioxygenase-like lactoylglutathione lyase family enzyme